MIKLHENENLQQSIEQITAALGHEIEKANNHFSLAVAGGSTPKPLYENLSQQAWPWENVQITLTDERWVDVAHEQSNETMIKQTLMTNHGASAYFLPLKKTPQPQHWKGSKFVRPI